MKSTGIFKNGAGDFYEVTVSFDTEYSGYNVKWRVNVTKKAKGKRKSTYLGSTDDELRSKGIAFKDYGRYRIKEYLEEIPWVWIESVADDIIAKIRYSLCEFKASIP